MARAGAPGRHSAKAMARVLERRRTCDRDAPTRTRYPLLGAMKEGLPATFVLRTPHLPPSGQVVYDATTAISRPIPTLHSHRRVRPRSSRPILAFWRSWSLHREAASADDPAERQKNRTTSWELCHAISSG